MTPLSCTDFTQPRSCCLLFCYPWPPPQPLRTSYMEAPLPLLLQSMTPAIFVLRHQSNNGEINYGNKKARQIIFLRPKSADSCPFVFVFGPLICPGHCRKTVLLFASCHPWSHPPCLLLSVFIRLRVKSDSEYISHRSTACGHSMAPGNEKKLSCSQTQLGQATCLAVA